MVDPLAPKTYPVRLRMPRPSAGAAFLGVGLLNPGYSTHIHLTYGRFANNARKDAQRIVPSQHGMLGRRPQRLARAAPQLHSAARSTSHAPHCSSLIACHAAVPKPAERGRRC